MSYSSAPAVLQFSERPPLEQECVWMRKTTDSAGRGCFIVRPVVWSVTKKADPPAGAQLVSEVGGSGDPDEEEALDFFSA